MKTFLAVLCIVSAFGLPVFASDAHPLICAKKAVAGRWTGDQAVLLCSGAVSDAPIACAEQAVAGRWTGDQAVLLCSGAVSDAPIICAEQAVAGRWTGDQAVRLCRVRL